MAVDYTTNQLVTGSDSRKIRVFRLYTIHNYDNAGANLYYTDLDDDYLHSDGNTYKAIPIKCSDFTTSDDGKLNNVTLSVGNVDRAIEYYILNYELEGKIVDITQVFKLPDNTKQFQDYTLEIASIKTTEKVATFSLSIGVDILLEKFPKRRVYANQCMWKFKGTECAYAGADSYCSKTLADCEAKGNTGNYGGFPSVEATLLWI